MPKLFLLLAVCCCLLSRPANSQAVAPLVPVVVRLDAGEVARRAYVCLDTATYRATRLLVAQVPTLRQRVQLLEYDRQLLSQQVREQHAAGSQAAADFGKLATDTRRLEAVVPRPPLLLDSPFWKGAGVGAVLAVGVKLLLR